MKNLEIVATVDYDQYVQQHGERLRRLSEWYRATYRRTPPKRKRPRHPAEERLLARYLEWERGKRP
jgi:hypothetical protein